MGAKVKINILPYGVGAVLVETPDTHIAAELAQIPGVIDAVVGAQTVLVTFAPGGEDEQGTLEHYTKAIHEVSVNYTPPVAANRPHVTVPVIYDGPDLEHVARTAGLSLDEVITRHTQATYHVAFMGFAPGFAYLEGLDPTLQLPRLDSPRTRVPAGAVAIAGPYSAIYPGTSPGGWLLLGHTPTSMFDLEHTPPALLAPGTRVTFEAQ